MASITEILQLCRLCLVKEQVNVPIFEEQGDIRQIFLKITACLPVKISREDKLPKKICSGCLYKLELLYQFWNTSTNAEKQLLSWLSAAGMDANTQTTQDAMAVVTQTQVVLKQEPETTENVTVVSDPDNFILQAATQPIEFPAVDFDYQENFSTAEQELANNSINTAAEDSSESEPLAKRARRAATSTVTAPLIESEDDDADDPGEAVAAKTEEDSDDDTNMEPTFVDVAEDQDDEQPGPSGLGKIVEPPSKEDKYQMLYKKYKDVHKLKSCVVLLGDLSDVDPTIYTFFKKRPVTITSEVGDENIVKGQRCKYKCEFCGKRFVDYVCLDTHRAVHARKLDDSPEEKSASSDDNYSSEASASSSDEKVEEDAKYHCKFCNRSFKYSYTYANHLKQHPHFTCSKCHLKFHSQEQLEDHVKEAHKSIKCSKCTKEFQTEGELKEHYETHKKAEDGDTWPCDICNVDLMDYESLVSHNKDNHSLVCNLCDKQFSAFEQLTAHKYFAHINPLNKNQRDMERQRIEKIRNQAKQQEEQQKRKELELQKEQKKTKKAEHTCNLCRKTFDNPKDLESHESTHYSILTVAMDNSQDEHKCTLCNKVCANKEALSSHLKKHIVVHKKSLPKPKPLESENKPSSVVTDKAVTTKTPSSSATAIDKAVTTKAPTSLSATATDKAVTAKTPTSLSATATDKAVTTKTPTSSSATAMETFSAPKTTTVVPKLSIAPSKMCTTISKTIPKPPDATTTTASSILKVGITKSPVGTSGVAPIKFSTVATTETVCPSLSTLSRKPVLKKIIVPPSSIITETTTVQAPPVNINPPQPQQRQLYVVNDKRCFIISQDQATPSFKLITTDALQNKQTPIIATQAPLIHALPSIQPINNFLQPSINQTIVLPNSPTNSQISITNKTYNTALPQEVNQGTTNIIYSPADPRSHKTYSRKSYVLTTTPQLVKVTNPSEILRSTTITDANKSPRAATTSTKSDSKEKSYKPKIFLKPLSQLLEKPADGSAPTAPAPTAPAPTAPALSTPVLSTPALSTPALSTPSLFVHAPPSIAPTASATMIETTQVQSSIQTQLQSNAQRQILPKPQSQSVLQPQPYLVLQPQPSSQSNPQPDPKPVSTVQAVEESPSTSTGQEVEDNSNDAASTADNSDDEKSDSSKSGIRKVYKCAVCKVTMRRSGKLLSHQTKYKCKVCKYTCCKLKILDNHYILKHDYKNRCASCDMQFPTNLELQMHKKVVHLCIKCNRCYFDLEKHKVSFKCLNCEFGACNAANLDAHYKLVHQITTRCAPCNTIFYDASQFQKHKEDVHFCDSCRTFKMDLNVHKTFCKGIKKDEEEVAIVEESNEVIEIDSE